MKGQRTDLKNKEKVDQKRGRYWLRVTVGWNGEVLLDNVVISNVRYLGNYIFSDDELALLHQKRDNEIADNLA